MKSRILIIAVLSLFMALTINNQTALFFLCLFTLTHVFQIFFKAEKRVKLLFADLFLIGGVYALTCFSFMTTNNYDHLLAIDTGEYFMPNIERYLKMGSLSKAMSEIWSSYQFFGRGHSGFFAYTSVFSFLSKAFDLNLYFTIQISTLLIYCFSGVIVFKLFLVNGFLSKRAYRYTLIIFTFSVVFFYSSQILRDIHVMFTFLMVIYLTFKVKYSIGNILLILLFIFLSCTLRIETGLFLLTSIPAYLYFTLKKSRKRILPILVVFAFLVISSILFIKYATNVEYLFNRNQTGYVGEVADGDGTIAALQKIPIAGDFASILYNALQPIPSWRMMSPSKGTITRPQAYNVMTFPYISAAFFNLFVIIILFLYLINHKLRLDINRKISKPLKFQLWIGLIFLFVQSAVVSQRRLLAYYIIFYILTFIVFDQLTKKNKKYIFSITGTVFILLQIFGLLYK